MTVQFCVPAPIFTPYTKDEIHVLLKNNPLLACQIVVAIWQLGQTADEKANGTATHQNGTGFSSFDAKFASSLAEQIQKKGMKEASKSQKEGGMSWKQMKFIFKFANKYAGQAMILLNGDFEKPAPIKAKKAPVKTRIRRKTPEQMVAEQAAEMKEKGTDTAIPSLLNDLAAMGASQSLLVNSR
jgi:hypothetical protein